MCLSPCVEEPKSETNKSFIPGTTESHMFLQMCFCICKCVCVTIVTEVFMAVQYLLMKMKNLGISKNDSKYWKIVFGKELRK